MFDFLGQMFDPSGFTPRWYCGSWSDALGWLHILSDLAIWSAYFAIPVVLVSFVLRRRDVPFRGIFWLFGAFILACGTTHLMEAIIFWHPLYRLAGAIKLVTALVSWGTVIALVPIVPKALAMRSPEELKREIIARKNADEALHRANADLEGQVEALRTSEERFRLLVESSEDYAILMLDPTGKVTSWNPGAQRITQYRADEIVGQHFSRLYPKEAVERGWPDHELRVAAEEGRFEDEGWRGRKDGSQFWANVVITAFKNEAGNLRGFSNITRDLTLRKQAEEDARRLAAERAARQEAEANAEVIRAQQEQLRITLESIGDAVIATDAQANITVFNPVAQALTGWRAEEAIGQPLGRVLNLKNEQTGGPVENPMGRVIRDGGVVGLTNHTILVAQDGAERPIEDSAAPIKDSRGNRQGGVLVFHDVSERRRQERALREEQRRFHAVFNQQFQFMAILARDGTVLEANHTCFRATGVPRERIVGHLFWETPWWDRLPATQERWKRAIAEALRSGGPVADEVDYSMADDSVRHATVVVSGLKDEAGHVTTLVVEGQDDTDRKRAEESLRQSEQRFARFMQHLPGLAWIKDLQGRYIYANDAAVKVFRCTRDGLYGKTDEEVFPPETAEQFRLNDCKALASEAGVQVIETLGHEDGIVHHSVVTKFPILGPEGTATLVGGMAMDITDRLRAERVLAESEERFRQLAENINEVFWMTDPQTTQLLYISPAYERIWGRSGRSLFENPRSFMDAVHPDDQEMVRKAVLENQSRGEQTDKEYRVVRPDGSIRWVRDRAFPVKNAAGQFYRLVGVIDDFTEKKHSEETIRSLLRISERMNSTLDTEDLLDLLVQEAVQLVGAESGVSGLRQPEGMVCHKYFQRGQPLPLNYCWPPMHGLPGWLLVHKVPYLTNDALADTQIVHELCVQFGVRSALSTPILSAQGEVLGFFEIHNKEGGFAPADQQTLLAVSHAASIAIQNALAYRQVRQAEESLREATATLRSFYDTAPIMMGVVEVTDDDILHLTDNAATGRFFGVQPGGLARRRASEMGVAPDPLRLWIGHYRESERTGQPVRFEYPHDTGAATRWLSAIVYCMERLPEGRSRCSYVAEDVTDRKRVEQALRESEERFRQLADAMPQIVWTAGSDGIIDYSNRRWYEYSGSSVGVGNGGWRNVVHPDDFPPAAEQWSERQLSGTTFEMELRLRDGCTGSYRWHLMRTVPVRNAVGAVLRWYGTATDIDRQKRAGEAARFLAEASAALAGVQDYESTLQKVVNLAVPYFADWSAVDVTDEGGSLRRLAVAHQQPEKIRLAQELLHRYPANPDAAGTSANVLRSGRPYIAEQVTDEMLIQAARDEEHLRSIRLLGLRSYICVPLTVSGKTLGSLTFATAESGRNYDRSDLALAEELAHRTAVTIENADLYRALKEADRRKDEFLATLAHELRNPLAPIRNAVELLRCADGDSQLREEARSLMERQLQRMVRLVDDLLDVSRITRGKVQLRKELVVLKTVVDSAVEAARPTVEGQGHQLTVTLPGQPIALDGDPTRLAQVFANLLDNAAKYTDKGGRIWLTAERQDAEVVVCVRDTGIGIPAEQLPHLFEMFSQLKPALERSQGGLGIGLSLVHGLVELHEGRVEARSAGPGQGSEFLVYLPVVEAQAQPAAGADASANEGRCSPKRRILVADDNVDGCESLAMMLRLMGHDIQTAHDGLEAVQTAAAFRPDVAILDIGMPKKNGYEVARSIRAQSWGKRIVLVALTGWGQEEDKRQASDAGFDLHVTKPVEPAALEKLLAE